MFVKSDVLYHTVHRTGSPGLLHCDVKQSELKALLKSTGSLSSTSRERESRVLKIHRPLESHRPFNITQPRQIHKVFNIQEYRQVHRPLNILWLRQVHRLYYIWGGW